MIVLKITRNCLNCNHHKTETCGTAKRSRFQWKRDFNKFLKDDSSECKDHKY